MSTLRPHLDDSTRRSSRRRAGAQHDGPGSGAAPDRSSGAAPSSAALSSAAASSTAQPLTPTEVRTTVDQQHVVDGEVQASVLHDVLVNAGVVLDANDLRVSVGTPRLVNSTLTPSADGRTLVREDDIELTVVLHTRQQLSLFVDALAGATVDGATLTLTPRSASAPAVSTTIDVSPGDAAASSTGSGS